MDREILQKQIEYYRSRASEYDETVPAVPPSDSESSSSSGFAGELAAARDLLVKEGPVERVLELACGTGIWTETLLKVGRSVTAVDAAPEMLEIARRKLGAAPVRFLQADLFDWEPDADEYDLVFFAFWLSHVPPTALDAFLRKVCRAVRPGGKLVIVDQYAPTESDRLVALDDVRAARPLRDGRSFTIVKVFYDPERLVEELSRYGLSAPTSSPGSSSARTLGSTCFYLSAARSGA